MTEEEYRFVKKAYDCGIILHYFDRNIIDISNGMIRLGGDDYNSCTYWHVVFESITFSIPSSLEQVKSFIVRQEISK